MRYPASEKLEIIRLVEHSNLTTKQTLDRLGIPRRTFYRWYDRYLNGGPEALEDRSSAPSRVWNRIPAGIHDQIIEMALEHSEMSPRELAVRFTDEKGYFISEASVYRLLKAHDLITSPAYVVIKAANAFHTKTSRPNQMWQTDFTYFKIIGWGWMYLSTVLDDYSRYIIAWKLCSTMRAQDVTDTLDIALAASGCDQAHVQHRPRLLSDNGPSYIAQDLADYIRANGMDARGRVPQHRFCAIAGSTYLAKLRITAVRKARLLCELLQTSFVCRQICEKVTGCNVATKNEAATSGDAAIDHQIIGHPVVLHHLSVHCH
jgi:putative transposase